ncbi:MAG: Methylcobamide:CoM methyltransferase MtaA [Methanomassiliicoccales archaeon PtaU1.Bin124]|nr:MAG: Methylcobamide:CoM methyltransferase MtaA [Methanomassiliicoccales archaeon PtaU1.Bin124]
MHCLERFDAALGLRPVDRPPIFYQHLGAAKWILQHTKLTMRNGFEDPEVFAKLSLASHELFGFDNVMAGWGDLLVESQAHGLQWKFPERDFYPRPAQYLDMSKVDEVRSVDPMKDHYWSVPLRAASMMQEKVGREVKVFGCLNAPTLIASEVVGMENLLMGEYTSPDAVLKLAGTITESCKAYGEHVAKIGLDTVFMDSSSAGMDLNPLDACEKFDLTFQKSLIESFRSKGVGIVLHNDSQQPYLDEQMALRPAAMHFHLKNVIMNDVFDKMRGKMCVFAGIDHQELLFQKTPAEVSTEVRRIMTAWGNAPGFVMAPGCELPYKTPIENLNALKEATGDHPSK